MRSRARIPIADLARIVIDRATSRRREPTKLILGRSPAHCPVTDARLSLLIYIYKRGGSRRDILECPRFLTCPRRQRAHTRQHLLAISSFEGRPSSCSSSLPALPSPPPSLRASNYTPDRKGAEMLKEKVTGQTVKMNGSFATGLNHAHVTQ